jgi:hypothetical protein
LVFKVHIYFSFLIDFVFKVNTSVECRPTITANGLALGAVADFGAQNCQYTTKVDARENVQLTTEPAIEPNACWLLCFLSSVCLSMS